MTTVRARNAAIALAALLAACDPLDESGHCDNERCAAVVVLPLPADVHAAELALPDGTVFAGVDCPPADACDVVTLAWLSDWGEPRGFTLRAGGRTWRVSLGAAAIEQACTRGCLKRYRGTLKPL